MWFLGPFSLSKSLSSYLLFHTMCMCWRWQYFSGREPLKIFKNLWLSFSEFEKEPSSACWSHYDITKPCHGFPGGSDSKEFTCNAGGPGSILGSRRSPGEGNGYPLWYSCLENPMERKAWQATVHGVAESDLTEQLTHSHMHKVRKTRWRLVPSLL